MGCPSRRLLLLLASLHSPLLLAFLSQLMMHGMLPVIWTVMSPAEVSFFLDLSCSRCTPADRVATVLPPLLEGPADEEVSGPLQQC